MLLADHNDADVGKWVAHRCSYNGPMGHQLVLVLCVTFSMAHRNADMMGGISTVWEAELLKYRFYSQ